MKTTHRFYHFFIIFLFCALTLPIFSQESTEKPLVPEQESEVKIQKYPPLQMEELTLKNGLRVILKQTDDNSDICMRLTALGGYNSANLEDRASAELAAPLVIESGLGDLCADKLSAFLYDHSIEFNLKIEPFMRGIDLSLPEESLDASLGLIKKVFISPKFCPEAFNILLAKKKTELSTKVEEVSLDHILNLVSQQEKLSLHSLKIEDLAKADFSKAKQFFCASFSNPADFVCVIAGDIDMENTKNLCIQNFSILSATNNDQKFSFPKYNNSSKKVVLKTQNLPNSKESLVRLAFPLQINLDPIKMEQLELICQIAETRLRNVVKRHSYDAKGVDVWYELPLYPSLEHCWLTIQFHVGNNYINPSIDLVVEELKNISKKGFNNEEINLAATIKRQSLKLWEHDNDYWIVLLSNHYLWGWSSDGISEKFKNIAVIDAKELNNAMRTALLIENYTFSQKD